MIVRRIINLNDYENILKKYDYPKKHIGFFQRNFFLESCKNKLNQDYSIFLISNKTNFVILPFCSFRYNGLYFDGFLGSPDLCEENDVIHNFNSFDKFSDAIKLFFEQNKKRYFFCNLKDGYFLNFLKNNKKFFKLRTVSSNCVNIKKNFYVNKNKIEKSISYDLRKFDKDTQLKNKFYLKDISFKEFEYFNILKFIKLNKSIKKKGFSKILNFLIHLFQKKVSRINVLKIDNIILSIIIYFVYEKKLYYILPTYNNKFKKYSFGKIHLDKLIKTNKEVDYLFLGPGEENYKKKFNLSSDKIYFFSNSIILKYYYLTKSIFNEKNS